jgi:hypothetical protein
MNVLMVEVTTRLTAISKETSTVSCLPWIPIPKLTTDFIIYLLVKLALTKQMQLHLAEEILEQKIVDWNKAKLSAKRSQQIRYSIILEHRSD